MHRWVFCVAAALLLAPAAFADEVKWAASLDEGLKAAADSGKLLLIDFFASWCPYCKKMHEETYPDPGVVKALNDSFVCVKVDGEEQADLARKYRVRGFPTTAFVDGNGDLVYQFGGERTPVQFLEELKRPAEEQRALQALQAEVESSPDDPKARFEFGVALSKRAKVDAARPELARVRELDPVDKAGYGDDIEIVETEWLLDEGKFADAEKALAAFLEKRAGSALLPKAYLFLGFAQFQQKRQDEALATWKTGIERFPEAPESRHARKLMERVPEK